MFFTTATIDVNQISGAGTNQTLTFAPGGCTVAAAFLNVTGGNGYRLSLGPMLGNQAPRTLNPTSASLTIESFTAAGSQHWGRTDTLELSGTAVGNVVSGAVSDARSGIGWAAVTKSGSSTWELQGANTYSQPTNIVEGTSDAFRQPHGASGSITVGTTAGLNGTLNIITNGNFHMGPMSLTP
jgi:autotransporter-associated beta strand protein